MFADWLDVIISASSFILAAFVARRELRELDTGGIRKYLRIIAIGLLAAFVAWGLFQLGRWSNESSTNPQVTETEVTRIVEVTVPVIVEDTQADNAADFTTNDVSQESQITSPSPVPAPTDIAILPVQPVGFVFSDDFERGLDPAWENLYGFVSMANGRLTVTKTEENIEDHFHTIFLRDYRWTNAEIVTNVASVISGYQCPGGQCKFSAIGGIIIRYVVDGQSLALLLYPEDQGIEFGTINHRGEWTSITGTRVYGDGEDVSFTLEGRQHEIKVEALGNVYIAYIDDERITATVWDGPTEGPIGLWFQSSQAGVAEGNPERFATRFEDIRITSLPEQ